MKFKDRPEAEQQAITEYMRTSHKSNLPKDVDSADWKFYKTRSKGKLDAAL